MWKVCQLLKGGRSHISRSRNANRDHHPINPSSSSSAVQEESIENGIFRNVSRRPLAFTPSVFRLQFEQNRQENDEILAPISLFSKDRESPAKEEEEESAGENESSNRGYYRNYWRRHRRPGHDHDGWHCRCRCRFGEFLSYTTMVAATIHLSRVTVHLLPNNNEHETERANDPLSVLSELKIAIQNGWQRFFYRTAPILFPDLFKRWYVLPPTRLLALSNSQETGDAVKEDASSSSSASSPSSRARSSTTSDDCAVQTDSTGVGTPFDSLIRDSGRRLAALSRLTDVGLEHAIGVDFLKRRLYDEAIDYLLGAAQSGHASAMYNLGICYSRGYGVRRDMTKAVEMWREAADQGHGLAKYQMGTCHARGIGGLAMDFERALRYMQAAAATGVPEAKTYLAAHEYKQGRLEGALDLLRQAIAGGDEKAKELMREFNPGDDNQNRKESANDGYTFASLTKQESNAPAKRTTNAGRRRFWASSSSEKEDSLSTSSASSVEKRKSVDSGSSIVFCDDRSIASDESNNGGNVIETVASLLTLGSLRRSRTAPEIRNYEHFEVATATTGKMQIDEL